MSIRNVYMQYICTKVCDSQVDENNGPDWEVLGLCVCYNWYDLESWPQDDDGDDDVIFVTSFLIG